MVESARILTFAKTLLVFLYLTNLHFNSPLLVRFLVAFPATFGKNVVTMLCLTKHNNSTGLVKRNKSNLVLLPAGS